MQFGQHVLVVGGKFTQFALGNLVCPVRIGDQRPTHCDQIKLITLEALEKVVYACRRRVLEVGCPVIGQKISIQSDATHSNRGFACKLLRPSSKIEVTAFKLWFPEAPCGTVEDVNASLGERV